MAKKPEDNPLWYQVDDLAEEKLLPDDAALSFALENSAKNGLPDIAVSPAQAEWLKIMALSIGAKRILEIGTLGGYSSIAMARALPEDGKLITLEVSDHNATIAAQNIDHAGLSDKVEIRIGSALDILPGLQGGFDMAFIDADKGNNPYYLEHATRLCRIGGVIIIDNIVRNGQICDENSENTAVKGSRAAIEKAGNDPRLTSTIVQTVGHKSWDGVLLAYKNSD